MTRRKKIVIGSAALVLFAMSFAVSWAIWTVQRSGSVEIRVTEQGGDDIAISIPGGIVTIAALLAPDGMFHCAEHAARNEIPLMRAVCNSLQDSPDFVLVEAEAQDDFVRIWKEGGKLVVRVESGDDTVRVDVPIFLFRTLVGKMDRAGRA